VQLLLVNVEVPRLEHRHLATADQHSPTPLPENALAHALGPDGLPAAALFFDDPTAQFMSVLAVKPIQAPGP
jgi:hypothetical protein